MTKGNPGRTSLVHYVVPRAEVLGRALEIAGDLAAKAPLAMKLDRAWFAEMTEPAFQQAIKAAIKAHRLSYASGEPARNMGAFMAKRGNKLGG